MWCVTGRGLKPWRFLPKNVTLDMDRHRHRWWRFCGVFSVRSGQALICVDHVVAGKAPEWRISSSQGFWFRSMLGIIKSAVVVWERSSVVFTVTQVIVMLLLMVCLCEGWDNKSTFSDFKAKTFGKTKHVFIPGCHLCHMWKDVFWYLDCWF